jgi:tagatose 1,6-diphosphate aldolase
LFEFEDFNYLTDGEIDLIIDEKAPADDKKGYVPAYKYKITLHGSSESIGNIDIRIGNNENLYYGGHIGYRIDEPYRGNNYASKACSIIKLVAAAHGMDRLIITCNPDNIASRRTCEKTGLKLLKIVNLTPHNEMYKEGEREKCIYEWNLKE